MSYQWNKAKRATNIAKHGIDFSEAQGFEWSDAITVPDTRTDYGEVRWISTAPINGRIFVMVWVSRNDHIRIISLRKANRREVINYESQQ